MKKNNYALKGSLRRIMAFLLVFVMLVTSDGMSVLASQDAQNDETEMEASQTDEQDQNVYLDNGDMQIESTDSIGAMLLGDIEEKKEEAEKNDGTVFSAEVSGNKATFRIQTIHNGTIIAAVYDDAGEQLITSAKTDVSVNDDSVTVVFAKELPEYFYLRAYIVNDEMAPLSEVYECPLYTQGMQTFLSKTTDDFAEEDVLNLDGDKANNFLVYQDGIVRIKQSESNLLLNDENEEALFYLFSDPNAELAGIVEGSILSYEMLDGRVLIISVKSIERNGTDVSIYGKNTEEEEVFSFIKIDTEAYASEADIDNSDLEEGVIYEGCESQETGGNASYDEVSEDVQLIKGEGKTGTSFTYSIDITKNMTGSLGVGFEASVKYYFDLAPWKWNGNYCEVQLNYELNVSLVVSGSTKGKIRLGRVGISPIPGVFIEFRPSFIAEATAELSYTARVKQTIGFRWEKGAGVKNISGKPKFEHELKGEINIFIGLSLEPKIKILSDKIAKASITAKVGGEVIGSLSTKADTDTMHGCMSCVDGDINFKAELSFEASLAWGHWTFKKNIAEVTIKIADWYYSYDDEKFGFGTCPHELYKVTFRVMNSKKEPIRDARISGGDNMIVRDKLGNKVSIAEITTDAKGEVSVYQANGFQNIGVKAAGYEPVSPMYWVEGEARSLNISMPKENEKKNGGSHSQNGNENPKASVNPGGGDATGRLKNPVRNGNSVTYSTVYFGNYWQNDTNGDGKADKKDVKNLIRWRVLNVTEDDIFLLADKSLDWQPYNSTYTDVTWKDSTIRSWLNGYSSLYNACGEDYSSSGFISNAFNSSERAIIKNSTVINSNHSVYDTEGGENTEDKIFLLSEAEAVNSKYGFLSDPAAKDQARIAYNTAYNIGRGVWNYQGRGVWWLRSPGKDPNMASAVIVNRLLEDGATVLGSDHTGVRPALHIPYSSKLYSVGDEIVLKEVGDDLKESIHNPIKNEDGSVTYSTVYFGKYWQNDTNSDGTANTSDNKEPIRWRVLNVNGDDVFLLADKNLDSKAYNDESTEVTWETSDIRSWMNGEFINSAFTSDERSVIRNSELNNNNNISYDTPGGNNTTDKVFLLSETDIYNSSYGFSESNTEYDFVKTGYNTAFASDRGASENDGISYWWLRTPGYTAGDALYVDWYGLPAVLGTEVNDATIAVRPALHISLSSALYTDGNEITVTEDGVEESGNCGVNETDSEEKNISESSSGLVAVFASFVSSEDSVISTASFTGLENKAIYNLYVMKNEFAEDSLSDDNLMYISQGISDEDGKLTFSYCPKEVSNNMAVFVVGTKDKENSGSTDPTDPTDPSDPVNPTDPTEPSNPDTPENNIIALTGIAVDKKAAELTEGETLTLNLSFTPENATNKKILWSSSDEKVATVADGVVTAVKEGKAIIKAVSEDGKHEAICEVTVKAKEGPLGPDKPDLSRYTASGNEIAVKSINLKKTVFKGVKGIKKFELASGDAGSVKIKGSTLTVLKDGTVTVAALNKKKEKIAEKTITLIAPSIDTTLQTEISRRGNLDLNKYISSTVKPAKWKSSSKKIAEVSQDGLLTMKKSGKVKITVTFPAEKGMKAKTLTIKLNIKMPQFKKTTYTVKTGKSIQTAVKNADTTGITYKTENPAIATVDASGKVTGVSKGTTKLIMTVKGIDYETKIKVK
ncbi:MAG: DUF6273 domain-containing protein [Lachnospiraceae bacterium]|nr:DUF6273 domain-containing protein [Lachnospiraceae bacterium]